MLYVLIKFLVFISFNQKPKTKQQHKHKHNQGTRMNARALSQLLLKRSTFSSVNVRTGGLIESPLIGNKLKDIVV